MGVVNVNMKLAETRVRLEAAAVALAEARGDWYDVNPVDVDRREAAWARKVIDQCAYDLAERNYINAYREDKITRGS